MRALLLCVLLVLASGMSGGTQHPQDTLRAKTDQRLQSIVSAWNGIVGYAAIDLTSGASFTFNDSVLFPQASAIKIPILMEVYRQAAEGAIDLNRPVSVSAATRVGGSGVLQFLGTTSQFTVRDLCVLMIVLSDNTATNMVIDMVGMENINRMLQSNGLHHTRLRRRMMDLAASGRGDENTSCPADAAAIMAMLHKGAFVSRAVSDSILAVLRLPKGGEIKSGLRTPVPVAFKPGGIPGVATEWAIVELAERPYALAVMTSYGVPGDRSSPIREISATLYDYFWRLGNATRYGTYVEPRLIR